jgi:hypothetical protein
MPHASLFSRLLFSLTVPACIVFSAGCNKPAPQQPTVHSFLKNLPNDTIGFYAIKSPEATPTNQQSTDAHGFGSLFKHLQQLRADINIKDYVPEELIAAKPTFAVISFRKGVQSIEPLVAIEFDNAVNGCDLKEKLADGFMKGGFTTQNRVAFHREGVTLFLGCNKHALSFGLSQRATDSILGPAKPDTIPVEPAIFSQVATETLQFQDPQQLAVGYMERDLIARALAHASGDTLPASLLDDQPFNAMTITQRVIQHANSPEHDMVLKIGLSPKNANQEAFIMTSSESKSVDPRAIDSKILQIDLNHIITSSIIDGGFANLDQEQAALLPAPELIRGIHGLSLGFIPAANDTSFPGAFIEIKHERAEDFKSLVESEIKNSFAQQIPPQQWKVKQIEGRNVTYMNTPFGIGTFITTLQYEHEQSVVLASSEDTLKKIITSQPTIKPERGYVSMASLNFQELAKAIETLQNTLAVFTGGDQYLSNEELVFLKGLGNAEGSVAVRPQAIEITYRIKR